ncbi:SKA complex subunit 1 [Genypterus blacodes]|uniref:SKA complex subunit 1 n=1 Tax=Genypterus blacodes TaxID=154954 RepID=UPI003F7766D7
MSDLEHLSGDIYDRISTLELMLNLSAVDLPQIQIKKLGQELFTLDNLLDDFEQNVGQMSDKLKHLKELEELIHSHLEDVQHLHDNIPAHMPRCQYPASGNQPVLNPNEEVDVKPEQPENARKTRKSQIRTVDCITVPEFEAIPQYMRGRVTYDQLNTAVQSINTAVTAKYKILHQSVRALNNHSRKLHQRFKDQETKNTKGQYFVVEADIQEFTQMKVDKRFQGIFNMLRHCQRLRELRGGGLTRYVVA